MTPKEKAADLHRKFYWSITGSPPSDNDLNAKRCAIICVDEIVEMQKKDQWMGVGDHNDPKYWQQVKKEIERL